MLEVVLQNLAEIAANFVVYTLPWMELMLLLQECKLIHRCVSSIEGGMTSSHAFARKFRPSSQNKIHRLLTRCIGEDCSFWDLFVEVQTLNLQDVTLKFDLTNNVCTGIVVKVNCGFVVDYFDNILIHMSRPLVIEGFIGIKPNLTNLDEAVELEATSEQVGSTNIHHGKHCWHKCLSQWNVDDLGCWIRFEGKARDVFIVCHGERSTVGQLLS